MTGTSAFKIALACVLFLFPAQAQAETKEQVATEQVATEQMAIRVLLAELTGGTEVAMPEGHRGFLDGLLAFETEFALAWPLEARSGLLYMDGLAIGRVLRLEALGELPLLWRDGLYRGGVELSADGDVLRVVNIVALEDYLRGVVPAEMHASWPIEALKAQAVAARSYVLAARDPVLDYDVCATVLCQVYGGASAEHPATDLAVAQTRGLVLTYNGALAKTYYHSHSGGFLASSQEVWGYPRPYLPGHADVASPPPHHAWDFRLDPAVMARSLAAQGVAVGAVRGLRVLDTSASGRVTRAAIAGDAGQVVLQGTHLTELLRSWGLKSTRFTMRSELVAQGGGYGHGVGMSQYGAYSLAAAGQGYEDILRFYYPGTSLEPLRAGLLEPAELAGEGDAPRDESKVR